MNRQATISLNRSVISKYGTSAHTRVARMLYYALTLDKVDAWWDFAAILSAHLTAKERAAIALMSLKTLPGNDALAVSRKVFPKQNFPEPPLLGYFDHASYWAEFASVEELEAYCLACFNQMHASRRAAFLDFVERRVA